MVKSSFNVRRTVLDRSTADPISGFVTLLKVKVYGLRMVPGSHVLMIPTSMGPRNAKKGRFLPTKRWVTVTYKNDGFGAKRMVFMWFSGGWWFSANYKSIISLYCVAYF